MVSNDLPRLPGGKTLEFKRDLSSPRLILRSLVAFANSAGGRLIVGVEDGTRHVVGVADHLARNDAHALSIPRRIVASLNCVKRPELDIVPARHPLYAPEEVYGVVAADVRKPHDVRKAIARIVDASGLDEFKAC